MNLHTDTATAIDLRIGELDENCSDCDPDDAAEWSDTRAALRAVAEGKTTEALAANPLAGEELDSMLERDEYWSGDRRTAAHKHIVADMCRAGLNERHDPNAVSTRRPKTMTVDGVRYVVG